MIHKIISYWQFVLRLSDGFVESWLEDGGDLIKKVDTTINMFFDGILKIKV